MRAFVSFALVATFALAAPAADEWPGFRGPAGDGVSPAKNVPTVWSEKENLRWKVEVHGKGWSSPVVSGKQVWVTTCDEIMGDKEPAKKGAPPANPVSEARFFAVCFDRDTGKKLHDIKLRAEEKPAYCHPFNSYASPTPVIEAGKLYAHFGSHGTFCVDCESGKVLWERLDFKCDHFRGAGSSPAVYGDLLYLIFDGADLQYVAALNKKTGETVWKADRKIKYSNDNGDYKKAYATPALHTLDGRAMLVCPSAECTIGYDPKTGEELWRLTHGGMNGSSRALFANGLLYVNSGHTKKLLALKPEGLKGAVPKDAIAWDYAKDVCTRSVMLIHNDLVFMVADNGIASCVESKTGKLQWSERLDGEFSASPVLAGGNVYFCGQVGKTTVVKADRKFALVSENRLADGSKASPPGFMASPAVAEGALFLRTATHLYCVGEK
jgi:outer membrane protein assembly factor BamB